MLNAIVNVKKSRPSLPKKKTTHSSVWITRLKPPTNQNQPLIYLLNIPKIQSMWKASKQSSSHNKTAVDKKYLTEIKCN